MSLFRALPVLLAYVAAAGAAPPPAWNLLQSPHFEIYYQGDEGSARSTLLRFEQLRALFVEAGVQLDTRPPVRVMGFRSVKEYNAYRLRPTAAAYYIGTETRDYIVMPVLGPGEFPIAAHEYAHLVLHAGGVHLPAWLNEGLAEFFSTVRIGSRECRMGGDIRSHVETLRRRSWIPLPQLFATRSESLRNREEASLYYAQSWALTEMLLAAPEYRPRFPMLISSLNAGLSSSTALTRVYGATLEAITADMRARINRGAFTRLAVPGVAVAGIKASSSALSSFASRSALAELLAAAGDLNRAAALYCDLARESPGDPDISAALGTIAFRQGDLSGARLKWKQALAQGVTDANLCYRYAIVAADAGVPANEIRPALERAVALNPGFDDARFKLALLEANTSNYEPALRQLKAMRGVSPSRSFAYWVAVSSAEDELGHHVAAKLSAQKALAFAATPEERAQASSLAYAADTELTVQFTRDANGNPQFVTTRVPRGTQNWSPFVEPQDHMRRADGQLRSVECDKDKVTGIAVDTAQGLLQLAIPDPLHVLIRGVTEFTCGPQPPRTVTVEYAASGSKTGGDDGVLRGMEIRPDKPFD